MVISGSITDDRAGGSVDLATKDLASGLWWDPVNRRLGVFHPLARRPCCIRCIAEPVTAVFEGAARGGSYWLSVKGSDAAGNPEAEEIALVFSVR